MKKIIISKLCIVLIGFLLLFGCATTPGANAVSSGEEIPVLTDIAIENGAVVIKSNKSFMYTVYNANDPYKATVEIPDMSVGAFTSKIVSETSGITEVIPQQIDSPKMLTRIDIILQTPSAISPSYENNTLVLSFVKEQPAAVSEMKGAASEDPESQPVLPAAEPPVRVIKAVDEKIQPPSLATEITRVEIRKAVGAVKVLITGNGALIPNVFPVSERIVVDIPDVLLKATLPENVIPPLKGIRAGKHKDKLRMVIDLQEKTNYDVTAVGNSIEISLLAKEMQVSDVQGRKATQTSSNGRDRAVSAAVESKKPAQPAAEPEKLIEGEFTGKKISADIILS
jgi:AMIN domain